MSLGPSHVVYRTGSPTLGVPVLEVGHQPPRRPNRLRLALRRLWRWLMSPFHR